MLQLRAKHFLSGSFYPGVLSDGTASVSLWWKYARECQEEGRVRKRGEALSMEALKGRQGRQKLLQSPTCSPGGGSLGTVVVVLLRPVACVPAMWCWLSVVPAHVERIRARKDMFFPLPSWKEDQGDLVTAQRFWACGQPYFPSRPSPRQPGRCTPSAGGPEPPRAPVNPKREPLARPAFLFPEPLHVRGTKGSFGVSWK